MARAEAMEGALLKAGESALAEFLELVENDALDGELVRGSVIGYWRATLEKALSHPVFEPVRADFLAAIEDATLPDDAYSAALLALEIAQNNGATAEERAQLLQALFSHPSPSLIASLSARVDGWLRRRISRLLVSRIRALGPDDLVRDDLIGREFDIPEEPGRARLVTEADWAEDDRPGEINWRARMRRDIRTAYTRIFGRQMVKQLERYGFTQKRWVSRHDERVRETHRIANGQIVGLYEPFHVGLAFLQYPGDPSGPANETINCRCVVVGVSGSAPRRATGIA